ncbi:hypothetical protein F5B21DRAFT_506568 [Xylaria acuta]|nr:hypothetical protein F5B21DRAFT_506568 [Xylaria acuta]
MWTSKLLDHAFVVAVAVLATARTSQSPDPIAQQERSGILSTPIYIFQSSQSATAALGKALETLGYTRFDPQCTAQFTPPIYMELPVGADYVKIAISNPEAKFLLPRELTSIEPESRSWLRMSFYGQGARDKLLGNRQAILDFFSLSEHSHQLLELDVYPKRRAGEQGQDWVRLCDFLGLGPVDGGP